MIFFQWRENQRGKEVSGVFGCDQSNRGNVAVFAGECWALQRVVFIVGNVRMCKLVEGNDGWVYTTYTWAGAAGQGSRE